MHPVEILRPLLLEAFTALYGQTPDAASLVLTPTRKEFEGDYTLTVFPLVRLSAESPEQTATRLGEWLMANASAQVRSCSVVKGFLNLSLQDRVWQDWVDAMMASPLPEFPATGEKVLVEFSSPNTNKPLHLGHVRNILLGWSMYHLLSRTGHRVFRVQVVNDRGIAICKSMLAWQKFGHGATPSTSGLKGDHFVGEYYVRFDQAVNEEYKSWQSSPEAEAIWQEKVSQTPDATKDRSAFFREYKNTWFNTYSQWGRDARDMLLAWEKGESTTRQVWTQMNNWVYEGFEETYARLGVAFDKVYHESETYLYGKDLIKRGLDEGIFYRKEDGSVWVDLSDAGLDHKVLLRSDGTSVYITQDIGTADERYKDFGAKRMIYVVADEQDYHFRVLFEVMKKLKAPYANGLHHLSYGMVELPSGRMKSREGTVVDADDLIDEVIGIARTSAFERGELEEISGEEQEEIFRRVGLAALKFHILRVNARKKMVFDPTESVDMQGHTGPYVQNAYVRIRSILRKAGQPDPGHTIKAYHPEEPERELLQILGGYKDTIASAARQYDPSEVANFAYAAAKAFHRFYHECPILRAEDKSTREFRLRLAVITAAILEDAFRLIGIEMPDRM